MRSYGFHVLILLGLLLFCSGCIPLEPLEGRPCPCPTEEDLQCCATTKTCIPSTQECPDTLPPSSGNSCIQDSDCPWGEICQSWKLPDNSLGGPGECRRDCREIKQCAQGEGCRLTLHNGNAMDRINISHACLSSVPPLGCEELNCSECDPTQVEHPYCHEDQVIGCFMALHVQCGVVCRQVQVEDCYPGECVQEDSLSAMCKQPQTDNTPCDMFSCENCPGEEPGTGACDTPDRLIKCLVSPYPGAIECENLCTLITQDCPEGQQCQEDGQTAFCSP